MATWIEVTPSHDVLCPKNSYHLIATNSGRLIIKLKYDVLVVVLLTLVVFQKSDPVNSVQANPIMLVVAFVRGNDFFQALERSQAHCSGDFAHLAVRADINHIVITSESEVSHQSNLFGQFVIVCSNRATLEGIEDLCRVEAEDLGVTKVSDHSSLIRTAERMRSIEKKSHVMAVGNFG